MSQAEGPALALHVEGDPRGPWIEGFAAAFPGWQVRWSDAIGPLADRVELAVVWAPPSGFLGGFPRLRRIVSVGAGTDHLDSDPSRPPAIPVITRQDPASTRAMAEFVLMQALLHHRAVGQSLLDRAARAWDPQTRGPLAGCRISLLGFGPMARATAELLEQFGCLVTAWSRSPKPHDTIEVRSGWDRLDDLFRTPDLLVNLLPSTPETRGLIDSRRLALLPRGAGFINVGRGDIVEQPVLLRALDTGHLALASLDVLPREPPPADDPVWTHPRVLLTPHVASLPLHGAFAAWVADLVRGGTV